MLRAVKDGGVDDDVDGGVRDNGLDLGGEGGDGGLGGVAFEDVDVGRGGGLHGLQGRDVAGEAADEGEDGVGDRDDRVLQKPRGEYRSTQGLREAPLEKAKSAYCGRCWEIV